MPTGDRLQVKTLNDFGDALNELEVHRLSPAMTSLRASLLPCKVQVKFLSFKPGNCTGEGYVG